MRQGLPTGLDAALDGLAARRPGLAFDVQWFDALPSTMDAAAAAAEAGARAGYVAIAGHQTAGRGRRGHSWCSPPGAGLYFSYLARPTRCVELVTLAAGVGILRGVHRATGLRPHLKWPNDVLAGTRKLAGVLAEGLHVGTPLASVTIGVGVNLEPAAYPPEVAVRATSLRTELGQPVSAWPVFVSILEHLFDVLEAVERGNASDILQAWRAAAPTASGTRVTWPDGAVERSGITDGIDDTGALLVRTPSGVQRIIAGELQWHLSPDC